MTGVKKFTAATMKEAFEKVKNSLGAEAVILHTRSFKKGGICGLFGKEMVEITASNEARIPPRVRMFNSNAKKYANSLIDKKYSQSKLYNTDADGTRIAIIDREIRDIKNMVRDLVDHAEFDEMNSLPEEVKKAYSLLIENEVVGEVARNLIKKVHNNLNEEQLKEAKIVRGELLKYIEKMLKDAEPIEIKNSKKCSTVAFIGPTGVGKTTTIPKLAADFRIVKKRKVGIITADTYRIAASDQLQKYAKILNVPMKIVDSPQEMKNAKKSFEDKELVLIDTAGRSQKDRKKMHELKMFLNAAKPDETHLLISATSNFKNIENVIEKFSQVHFDKLIFTKLDEAVSLGIILGVIKKLDKAMSYITTGQEVPFDIEISEPKRIAKLILGEEKIK